MTGFISSISGTAESNGERKAISLLQIYEITDSMRGLRQGSEYPGGSQGMLFFKGEILRRSAEERENLLLNKKEERFAAGRMKAGDPALNRLLDGRIPEKLDLTLEKAFIKAFQLIFEKGSGVIERSFDKEGIKKDFMVKEYALKLKNDRRSYADIRKSAGRSGLSNTAASGAAGIGMGVLGIGIPDIPVFTSMMFRSIFQIALRYGIDYDSPEEKLFALFLIRAAFSRGDEYKEANREVDGFIHSGRFEDIIIEEDNVISRLSFWEEGYRKRQMEYTARAVSKEVLYMKFLQGIPLIGAVGGAYDIKYMSLVTEYAELKYRKRFLIGKER